VQTIILGAFLASAQSLTRRNITHIDSIFFEISRYFDFFFQFLFFWKIVPQSFS
jgi:hypothetical protein